MGRVILRSAPDITTFGAFCLVMLFYFSWATG